MIYLDFVQTGNRWTAEYDASNGSGGLQVIFSESADVSVHGTINGTHYCLLPNGQMHGKDPQNYLDVDGLQKVKVVATKEPVYGVVNVTASDPVIDDGRPL